MKNVNLFLISVLLLSIYSCSPTKANKGESSVFPKISEAIQITNSRHEHFFASYFGINSFDKSERYATVLETDLKFKLPDNVNEPATLGLVDLRTHEFIPLTKTRAWNFQQGCMAHWLGTSPDSLIIYNDYRDGRSVSVIMNVHTKKEIKMFPYPVGAVSEDGKEAVSLNFSRIRLTRPDYGYGGDGQDSRKDVAFPKDDGIFLINLETGETKLLVSNDQVKDLVLPVEEGGLTWFNHTKFSKGGTKIFFFLRQKNKGDKWHHTTSFTIDRDGSNLNRCFPTDAYWGGSHFDWLNDNKLLLTASYEGKQYTHILFTPGQKNYEILGGGLLDYDGHGTFSPDGKWMVTDSYPNKLTEQKIYLLNMKTHAILPLGRFIEPEKFSEGDNFWRCDIHCRWSPKGNIIGFNSTHSGSRQAYIFKLTF